MGISYETLAASRKYTDDSLKGVGALAGKPCQIQSITPITGGNRVTFLWIDDNSDSHTSTMDVMNGAQGETGQTGPAGADGADGKDGKDGKDGVGIKSLAINSSNHLIVTLTDDNTVDAGEIPAVQSDWDQSDSSASDFIKNKPTLGTAAAKDSTDAVTEDSTDLVESGAVFTGLTAKANKTDVATDIQKVYTVMGQNGAKNYLQILASGTFVGNGITFVVNDDGTVTVSTDENGATGDTNFYLNPATQVWVDPDYPIGDYILSGCPAGGSAETYRLALSRQGASSVFDTGTGTTFTHASGVKVLALIQIGTGTVLTTPIVFKPMIRLAADTDTTYQPYAKTNQELTSNVIAIDNARIMYGVENILPNTLESGTAATSVTYTRNSDGTVSVSGSAVGNAVLTVGKITGLTKVRLTGCPSGGGGSAYQIQPKDLTDNTYPFLGDYGEGRNYTLNPTHVYRMDIVIREGYSISGTKLFKPMVVDLSAYSGTTYDDYVPYAKTNQQLTAENEALTNNININGSKNVLASLTPSGTYLGITISRNESGDIVVNGTATASPTTISLFDRTFKHIGEATILKFTDLGIDKTKKYVFSRAEKVSNFRYNIRVMNGTTQVAEIELGNDDGLYTVIDFSQYTCDGLKADIVVANGTTITNKVFSAMLCLESDYGLNPTYQPYAMTNRELTEKVAWLVQYPTIIYNGTTYAGLFDKIRETFDSSTPYDGFAQLICDTSDLSFAQGLIYRRGDRIAGTLFPPNNGATKEQYFIFTRTTAGQDYIGKQTLTLTQLNT